MNDITLQSKEKSAQLLWTGFILMFFVIQAVIWTFAISITSRDMSHAVVAGYDQQALNWDQVKQERTSSAALGWTAEIKIDPTGDVRGNRKLTLKLTDRENYAIPKAIVQIEAFHRGRASQVQTILLKEGDQGVYSGAVQVRHAGVWNFSGIITSNDQRFLVDQQLKLTNNKGL